jgi:hypothetical protein
MAGSGEPLALRNGGLGGAGGPNALALRNGGLGGAGGPNAHPGKNRQSNPEFTAAVVESQTASFVGKEAKAKKTVLQELLMKATLADIQSWKIRYEPSKSEKWLLQEIADPKNPESESLRSKIVVPVLLPCLKSQTEIVKWLRSYIIYIKRLTDSSKSVTGNTPKAKHDTIRSSIEGSFESLAMLLLADRDRKKVYSKLIELLNQLPFYDLFGTIEYGKYIVTYNDKEYILEEFDPLQGGIRVMDLPLALFTKEIVKAYGVEAKAVNIDQYYEGLYPTIQVAEKDEETFKKSILEKKGELWEYVDAQIQKYKKRNGGRGESLGPVLTGKVREEAEAMKRADAVTDWVLKPARWLRGRFLGIVELVKSVHDAATREPAPEDNSDPGNTQGSAASQRSILDDHRVEAAVASLEDDDMDWEPIDPPANMGALARAVEGSPANAAKAAAEAATAEWRTAKKPRMTQEGGRYRNTHKSHRNKKKRSTRRHKKRK